MKVLLINGSPHEHGCTHAALTVVKKSLEENGTAAEIFWIGNKALGGCTSCRQCAKLGRCVINDTVNEFRQISYEADGFVFGSPVHNAGISGNLTCFMDRLFFSERYGNKNAAFRLKPVAAIVSARRMGTTSALDQMYKYFSINEMPIISSRYWNAVHGAKPDDIFLDAEGIYVMETLGRYMAYFLRCINAANVSGIVPPELKPHVITNFIK